jgi:hypothetical protein
MKKNCELKVPDEVNLGGLYEQLRHLTVEVSDLALLVRTFFEAIPDTLKNADESVVIENFAEDLESSQEHLEKAMVFFEKIIDRLSQ